MHGKKEPVALEQPDNCSKRSRSIGSMFDMQLRGVDMAIGRNNMASVKGGRLVCRLLHAAWVIIIAAWGVPIIGPGGIKRGLLPKVFDPTCRSTRCTAYLSICSPFGVSKK